MGSPNEIILQSIPDGPSCLEEVQDCTIDGGFLADSLEGGHLQLLELGTAAGILVPVSRVADNNDRSIAAATRRI